MHSRIITAAELSPGQHVTVIDAAEPVESDHRNPAADHGLVMIHANGAGPDDEVERLRGAVLCVRVLDLPLVLFTNLSNRPCVLDSRKFQFMELKPEFVEGVRGTVNEFARDGRPIDVRELAEKHDQLCHTAGDELQKLDSRLNAMSKALGDHIESHDTKPTALKSAALHQFRAWKQWHIVLPIGAAIYSVYVIISWLISPQSP